MRVTQMMKNHITTMVTAKVQDKLNSAKAAADKLRKERDAAMQAVEDYAESLLPEMTKKVVEFAAKQGLTWLDHQYNYDGRRSRSPNYAFRAAVDDNDNYAETASRGKPANSAQRRRDAEIRDEPSRIKAAIEKTVDAICFDLELGKVKKAELEELIKNCRVKL